MVDGFGDLNGSGNQQVYVYNARTGQDAANNWSTYYWEVRYYGNGWGSWGGGTGSWSFTAGGYYRDGLFSIPQSQAFDQYTVLATGTYNWGHDGNGNLPAFNVRGAISHPHTSIGTGEVNVTEPAPPRIPHAPSQVPNLVISSITDEGAYLNWDPPNNNGSNMTGYDIQYSLNSDFSSGTVKAVGTTSAYTMTGLTAGKKYYFRVRGKNADGAGPYSPSASALLLPPAPTGLTTSAFTPTGMKVDWAAPTSATSYDIQYSTTSSFSGAPTTTSSTSERVFTSLKSATRYWFRVRGKNASGAGDWSGSVNNITQPAAPTSLVLSAVTTTGMTATWNASPNGAELTGYDIQWANNSAFTGATTVTSTTTTKALTGMAPGTTHYVRVRAKNANGTGAWSSTASQVTLPAVAPGLTVSASADGRTATLTFSPPGGVTGVTKYAWERRTTGTTTPVTTGDEPDTSETVTGLTPGTSYDWRASAWIGTYQSPWTTWITRVQPKPNVSAGDYFDGATTDTADMDYGWTGTANNSTSTATGKGVAGWRAFFAAPGAGTVHQVVGGHSHSFAARVTFKADAGGVNGLNAGTTSTPENSLAAVVGDGNYVASMWVNPSRPQRLAAYMYFYDAAFSNVGSGLIGDAVVAPAGVWTRLTVSGPAPDDALWASVRVRDVSGDGWSNWIGGEFIDIDDAMVTLESLFDYFDGAYPDTSQYRYDWLGTAHASVSTRTTLDAATGTDPLDDPDCADIPSPPTPPTVPADCIDEVGVWRRYWAVIGADQISEWLEVVPTVTVTSGRGTAEPAAPKGVNQVRIRYYENPDNLSPDQFVPGAWVAEQVISYMPPFTLITLDGVSERTWAEVDGGPALPADRLVYGTGGIPATWPVLSCGIGYLVTFDTPLDVLIGNVVVGMSLTERMG